MLEDVIAEDGVEGCLELAEDRFRIADHDLVVGAGCSLRRLGHDLDARHPLGASGSQRNGRTTLAAAHVQHLAERPRQSLDQVGPQPVVSEGFTGA